MQYKPNPNPDAQKREIQPAPAPAGGDSISVQGNVGPGSVVGRGSVTASNIAGGDLISNSGTVGSAEEFADLIAQLRDMLAQARDKGEMDAQTASQAMQQLQSAQELVKQTPKAPKPEIVKKLEAVTTIIDAAVDTLTNQGSVATILIKALPIAVMLVRLATRLF